MQTTISISGIGSILADSERGTLTPRTHVVCQRLGVGFAPDTTNAQERQRMHRRWVAARATRVLGEPEAGWQWCTDDGHPVYSLLG